MEQRYRVVNTRELLDTYREILPEAGTLPLLISGGSMSPFLVHGRDTVHLEDARTGLLKKGDMVLYQRDRGDYVLHRICRVHPDCYDIVGDAQTEIEPGVRRNQIFARVSWAERKGKRQAPGSFWWEFFEKVWIRMIPLRPVFWQCYRAVCRLTGRV